jgi:hypothetical protein
MKVESFPDITAIGYVGLSVFVNVFTLMFFFDQVLRIDIIVKYSYKNPPIWLMWGFICVAFHYFPFIYKERYLKILLKYKRKPEPESKKTLGGILVILYYIMTIFLIMFTAYLAKQNII